MRGFLLQGVPTRYDILWSPGWPTKVDFQVQKKVAAHSEDGDIWVLSIFFQKSNIGWPQQPLTSRLQDTSKNLDFWWSNPQKGISIGHFGARGDAIIKIRQFFEEKRLWRSLRSLMCCYLFLNLEVNFSWPSWTSNRIGTPCTRLQKKRKQWKESSLISISLCNLHQLT